MKKIKEGDFLYSQEFSRFIYSSSGHGRTLIGKAKNSDEQGDLIKYELFNKSIGGRT